MVFWLENYRSTWCNIFWYSPGESVLVYVAGLGAILTLGFGLPMESPPVDVILIIMTVVVAASAYRPQAEWIIWYASLVILAGVTRNIST